MAKNGAAMKQKNKELTQLIPGFYADDTGTVYLHMHEFLLSHGMPDAPAVRRVVWEEVREMFSDVDVEELSD